MQINNNDLMNKLASNMASSIGSLQVQLAKAETVVEVLQKQNAELQSKLATYERGDMNGTKRIKSDNQQESSQFTKRDTTAK
jgi:hypothetical protein